MNTISRKINNLIKVVIYETTKSKRTFTPAPFNNPKLTPLGIVAKKPRSYDYNLRQNLPNRHLYWNRTIKNKQLRDRYQAYRLQKLGLNPIHDQQGKMKNNRDLPELIYELTSLKIIKNSVGRTLINIKQALERFPHMFTQNGPHADVLQFALKQLHERHIVTMNFYKFSTYCYLRNKSKIEPTEKLMLHFYRFIQAARFQKNDKLTLERVGRLAGYIFSRQYPGCQNLFEKKVIDQFQLFTSQQGYQKFVTFEDILPHLFTGEQLKQFKERINQKQVKNSLKGIEKIPGGKKLIEMINTST